MTCFFHTKSLPPLSIRCLESEMDIRGHNLTLIVCRSNKKQRAESFTQGVVKPWNFLSINFVSANNVNTFKKRLDQYWRKQELLNNYKTKLRHPSRPNNRNDLDVRGELTIEV